MRILAWHVHGSWMTSFVQGGHDYLVPVLPDRGPDGAGRARTFDWPPNVVELTPEQLRSAEIDLVVLQRPIELELFQRWTGRNLGAGGTPAIYVEHNTPRGDVNDWRHVLADRADIPLAHVTRFNQAMWDNGSAPAVVIDHGVPDYGYRYTGELESLAVSVNEPVRRSRVAGTDLAIRIAREVPVAFYGMGTDQLKERVPVGLAGVRDVSQDELHSLLPIHLAYLHPYRWTSLGLSLIEAMTLGMPVLVLAATAAPEAVPATAGLVSSDVDELAATARRWLADRDEARACGEAARLHALKYFGLGRFLDDWNRLLKEVSR
ncbi:glycosyltransferase [Kribbella deserti]|uniref:Glycosyltransferase n=1 Tax=Kribbella deserti TaxID=1926257 RepID=A0ABV6QSA6_9ACTN